MTKKRALSEVDFIDWHGFHDGYGIVGYGFKCPSCEKQNLFADYWEDKVACEHCDKTFPNPTPPE